MAKRGTSSKMKKTEKIFQEGLDSPKNISYKRPPNAHNAFAQVAQLVEHGTENAGVGGSNPPLGTMIPRTLKVWGIFLLAPLPPAPPKPAHQGRPR